MSARTLVAYDAISEHARKIACEIREATGARLEGISEFGARSGLMGIMRALFDAIVRRTVLVFLGRNKDAGCDLLIIGGPVWAGRMPASVRDYVRRFGASAPRIAFFCTEGQRGAHSAFADLENLCARLPEAILVIDAANLSTPEHHMALARFVSNLFPPQSIETSTPASHAPGPDASTRGHVPEPASAAAEMCGRR